MTKTESPNPEIPTRDNNKNRAIRRRDIRALIWTGALSLAAVGGFIGARNGVEAHQKQQERDRIEVDENEASILQALKANQATRMGDEPRAIPVVELPDKLEKFVTLRNDDADRDDSMRILGLPDDLTKEEDRITFFPFPTGKGVTGAAGRSEGEQPLTFRLMPFEDEDAVREFAQQNIFVGSNVDLGDTKTHLEVVGNKWNEGALALVIDSSEQEIPEDAVLMIGVEPRQK